MMSCCALPWDWSSMMITADTARIRASTALHAAQVGVRCYRQHRSQNELRRSAPAVHLIIDVIVAS
jgi:hypothetical protein